MSSENIDAFCKWLEDNGAKFPKIKWPAINSDGINGGIAVENIEVWKLAD